MTFEHDLASLHRRCSTVGASGLQRQRHVEMRSAMATRLPGPIGGC
jgi:hypothetical protein